MKCRRPIPTLVAMAIVSGVPGISRAQTRIAPFVASASDGVDRPAAAHTFHETIEKALELIPELRVTWPTTEGTTAIAECGVDARCLGAVVKRSGATWGLAVALFASGGKQLISLRFVDTSGRQHEPVTTEADDVESAKVEMHQAILRAAARARLDVMGRAHVAVTPTDARVMVDRRPIESTTVLLSPGRHIFEASHTDYQTLSMGVDVDAGQTTDVRLDLVAAPPTFFARPATWIVIGGVAVLATVATVLAVTLRGEGMLTVCHGPETSPCP